MTNLEIRDSIIAALVDVLRPSSPACERVEAAKVLIEVPTSIEDLKRRFPNKADDISVAGHDVAVEGEIKPDGTQSDRWSPQMSKHNPKSRYAANDISMVEEYWLKDY